MSHRPRLRRHAGTMTSTLHPMKTSRLRPSRLLKHGAAACLLLAASACLPLQNPQAPPPATGERIAVDGARRLHLDCRGQGQPTVVLEAGMSGGAHDWAAVHGALAQGSRVCAYDRAGYGGSDPLPEGRARTPQADFERLLQAAGIETPVLLVGHSMGGLLATDFARRHPQRVAGLVLVDAVSRTQDLPDHPAVTAGHYAAQRLQLSRLTRLAAWLAPTGLLRWVGASSNLVAARLPTPARTNAVEQAWRPSAYDALRDENAQFDAWLAQSRALGPLPRVPAVVLRSTEARDFPPGMQDDALQSLWAQRQQELAAELGVVPQPVTGSGHYPHVDQPQAVIDAVQAVRAQVAARRGAS